MAITRMNTETRAPSQQREHEGQGEVAVCRLRTDRGPDGR